ncbi:hypothetical protein [Beggiatoa leptomitoformis]|uniref:Uncharacterized protein n=1 Tax=Beggiatoa leptomitoformis TaxID=288004 RepID=A0A2N9YHB7_9GAMM|nr:hypothetical protein [Beggiatoa leptomitoformis]ALG67865.1 hypothetical protein AL038_09280 [Beggiatoa leptomitoformis]AUI69874.1 hypothetical protein BLE401_15020 [Beggiatoa leptomitoformis]
MSNTDNLKIIMVNDGDNATLSCVPTPVTPIDNLKMESASHPARVIGTSITISGALAVARVASGCCLWNCNFSATVSISLTLKLESDTVLTVSLASNQAIAPDTTRNYAFNFFTETAYDEFIITITDTNNTDSYIDVGRLFIGLALSPQINIEYGYSWGHEDDSEQERTAGNSLQSDNLPTYRTLQFPLNHLRESERATWAASIAYVGKKKQIFVCLFPNTSGKRAVDFAFMGKFTALGKFSGAGYDRYQLQFTIEETVGGNETGTTDSLSLSYLSQITTLQQQVVQLQTTIASLQSQINTLQVAGYVLPEQFEEVQAELATVQAELATVQAELTTVQAELTTAQADLATAQADLAIAQADLVTVQAELTTAQSEIVALESTLSEVQKSLVNHGTLAPLTLTLVDSEVYQVAIAFVGSSVDELAVAF